MSVITRFKREDGKVVLSINSSLDVTAYNYPFSWDCNNENYAELLKEKLNEQLLEFKREIARNAITYLSARELSKLKHELKRWNSNTMHWK